MYLLNKGLIEIDGKREIMEKGIDLVNNYEIKRLEKHIFLKLAEELTELSVELLQAVNKHDKNNLG